ncbi:MAG: amidohydrolase [Ferruginibacter sp.]|nr:amidohydrolase [Ferruginibacter sp.]
MKKYLLILAGLTISLAGMAQDDVYPAPAYKGITVISNATVHVGNGQVLENTSIQINNGKIEKIAPSIQAPANAKLVDATGKHVYPGLILSNTNIGLREIASQVKGSNDYNEIGDLNPNIKSIVAYNADSKIINTLRSNGILFANVAPQGSLIAGSSSVVQFDAWNWQDAVYKENNGFHFYMPSLMPRPARFGGAGPQADPMKEAFTRIDMVKAFFTEAKAYQSQAAGNGNNLKLEAVKGLFNKSQKLFIHCDIVKEMLIAIDFVREFGFDVTIVGGSESYQMAPLLKQNNISVILQQQHSLPTSDDDDVDQPFKTPSILQKAGVLFAITDEDETTTGRNLMFNAGTASSYGLSREEALAAITLNAAKILGVADRSGSIEVGKDANIIISQGDILDMRNSVVVNAFIQGRELNLTDKHKQLNERYKKKYGIK